MTLTKNEKSQFRGKEGVRFVLMVELRLRGLTRGLVHRPRLTDVARAFDCGDPNVDVRRWAKEPKLGSVEFDSSNFGIDLDDRLVNGAFDPCLGGGLGGFTGPAIAVSGIGDVGVGSRTLRAGSSCSATGTACLGSPPPAFVPRLGGGGWLPFSPGLLELDVVAMTLLLDVGDG